MNDPLADAESLFAAGDELANEHRDQEALDKFQAAWDTLPEPREDQEPAIRVLAAIADCRFHLGDWAGCRDAIQHAFRCGAELTNPFLRLRLGQALYELGAEQEAANWLTAAYLSVGRALFAQDNPKYFNFFHSQLKPPPGGWPKGW